MGDNVLSKKRLQELAGLLKENNTVAYDEAIILDHWREMSTNVYDLMDSLTKLEQALKKRHNQGEAQLAKNIKTVFKKQMDLLFSHLSKLRNS